MKRVKFSSLSITIAADCRDDEYQAEARMKAGDSRALLALPTEEGEGFDIYFSHDGRDYVMDYQDFVSGLEGLKARILKKKEDFLKSGFGLRDLGNRDE